MVFRTCLSGTKEFVSDSGSPTLQEYEYSMDKTGHKMLVKKDSVINVYDRIQADRDSCDINLLMQRFVMGDSEALNKAKSVYIDVRDLPTSMAEVFERGLEAEQHFASLPVEFKEMFDNSASVYFSEVGTKEFDVKLAKYNDKFVNHQFDIKEDIEPIVKEDTQEINYHE